MDLSEFELIGRIAGQASRTERIEVGIGDDAAVIRGRDRIVTSVDTAVLGVHFGADRPPAESARKAVAAAVSDLAAMGLGSSDTQMLVALGAPAETSDGYLEGLADGVVESAREFGVELAGGDVVSSPVVFLSVTVIAQVDEGVPVLTRSGARAGDLVALTGPVGGAAAGLDLLQGLEVPQLSDLARDLLIECQVRPQPQLTAAPALAASGATSMIDVSDGLASDLGHIARASGVRLDLEADEVPMVPGVREVAEAREVDPFGFAVSGGEDYVLALTIPPDRFEDADSALIEATGFELLAIGRVEPSGVEPAGVRFENEEGTEVVAPAGHDHFRGPGSDSR